MPCVQEAFPQAHGDGQKVAFVLKSSENLFPGVSGPAYGLKSRDRRVRMYATHTGTNYSRFHCWQ